MDILDILLLNADIKVLYHKLLNEDIKAFPGICMISREALIICRSEKFWIEKFAYARLPIQSYDHNTAISWVYEYNKSKESCVNSLILLDKMAKEQIIVKWLFHPKDGKLKDILGNLNNISNKCEVSFHYDKITNKFHMRVSDGMYKIFVLFKRQMLDALYMLNYIDREIFISKH